MIRNISVGIDIGSSTTRVVVGEFLKGEKNPKIIGVGESPTSGLRHGYVVSTKDTAKSVKKAIALAEKTSGITIKKALVSIGGSSLRGEIVSGMAVVSKADGEVTHLDIQKAIDEGENSLNLNNKKIIQYFVVSYKLDGKEVMGRVEGLYGNKLEVKTIFITCPKQHFEDLVDAVAEANVETLDIIASPISSANAVLNQKQKIVGCALVDIGSETTSLSVFENDTLTYLQTFPIGANDITNDIALGFKTTLEEAENIKIGDNRENFSKKKIDEMINARMSDIFDLVENHLKKIKRNGLLPAGVIYIGGGSYTENLEEASKKALSLPSQIGQTELFGPIKTKLKEPIWITALGLLVTKTDSRNTIDDNFSNFFKNAKNAIKNGIKQLMP